MALTTQDKISLGQIGLQGATGLLSGINQGKAADESAARSDQRYAQERDDEFLMAIIQQIQQQQNQNQDFNAEQLQRALSFSQAQPLGAENNLRKSNALGYAGLDVLSQRQLARGTPSMAAGFSTRPDVQAAYDPTNIDEAIRQRRIATAGLDPRAQGQIGGEGSDYANMLFGELQANQNERRNASDQQMQLLQQQKAIQPQATEEPEKEKGFWSKLGSVALPIAGLAANFIPGVGPVAGALISAAASGAGGGLAGGKKGAAIGATAGGLGAYGMSKAGIGEPQRLPVGPEAPGNGGMLGTYASAFPSSLPNLPSKPTNMGPIANTPQSMNIGNGIPAIQSALSRPPGISGVNTSGVGNPSSAPFKLPMQQYNAPSLVGQQRPNAALNTHNINSPMPLIQSGLGMQDPNRLLNGVGNVDPQSQMKRAQMAAAIAMLLGGGSSMLGEFGNLPTATSPWNLGRMPQTGRMGPTTMSPRPVGGGKP